MSSLKDQLLNAGLVNKKQVQQAKKQKHQQKQSGQVTADQEARARTEQIKAEKIARDRDLNRQRQAAAEEKAIIAQIRQLIETNQVGRDNGEVAYNFTDGSKIKRLYLTELLINQLSNGMLAIVKQDEGYALVPGKVAERIAQRDPGMVLVRHTPTQKTDEEDPYADFQIPDDLMW
tara:strand:+ start:51 stop:578 length:528 start_codon:yes stop_codon:yes gene_type:complete